MKLLNAESDEVVISGMSGLFPSSKNIDEFEYNLYNKIDMVTINENQFKHSYPLLPKAYGKIPDLEHFDAAFFDISDEEANDLDPEIRLMLEESFKCVMDAGINPSTLRGSKTGVYMGFCLSESENESFTNNSEYIHNITSCKKNFLPHRISYILGLTGPSMVIDTACSSATTALHLAYEAIRDGEIDAAIVGGTNLCSIPHVTLQFYLLGILSHTDKCRPFDAEADGYCRAETISCIYLQKKANAKRIYATLIATGINSDGFKVEGITFPSNKIQEFLLTQTLKKANIHADDIGYVEAHCTSTRIGDPEECIAIDSAVCKRRSEQLLIGSVKSNCGHSETAAGMCSIAKMLLTLNNDIIPPNINFNTCKDSIEALKTGRLKVVTDVTKLPKPIICINSFGFGGANAHIIMKQYQKIKSKTPTIQDIPYRLVIWSGRTKETVTNFFNDLLLRPLDDEYLALAEASQSGGINGMTYRGYSLLATNNDTNELQVLQQDIKQWRGLRKPLIWVFSGMGSQWIGMGRTLMLLKPFNDAINLCHQILEPYGLNLIEIITGDNPNTFDNILHSFVGITAFQIALIDLLKYIGIEYDFIIGHSLGEVASGYADNCLTLEQTILISYVKGKISLEMKTIKGSMAAVGLNNETIKPMLPETIECACHNSSNSCTIAGPYDDVAQFCKQLQAQNIFVAEVKCSNIAYHSRYIAELGPHILSELKKIIPNPRLRSKKWISTSVSMKEWSTDACKFCSADYMLTNFVKPVLFEEALPVLPTNAVTIELAPHAFIQSILKNGLSKGTHIGLTKRFSDSVPYLLNAFGSIYNNGIEFEIGKLFPTVEFPVSRGTRALSSAIEFDNKNKYDIFTLEKSSNNESRRHFTIRLKDTSQYLSGHEIDGRILVPATFYLECVWKTLVFMNNALGIENQAVEFQNIKFERATTLSLDADTEIYVVIHRGTGHFEVTESEGLVAQGTIRLMNEKDQPNEVKKNLKNKNGINLCARDFYKELKLRGYHYSGEFKGVDSALHDGSYGVINWTKNWVTFLDCMLQLSIIGRDSRSLMLPTRIRTLKIFPQYHKNLFDNVGKVDIYYDILRKRLIGGGVEIIDLDASGVQRKRAPGDPVLEKYEFVPLEAPLLEYNDIARCCIQLALENQPQSIIEIIEIVDKDQDDDPFIIDVMQAVGDLPLIRGKYTIIHNTNKSMATDYDLGEDVSQIYSDENYENMSCDILVIDEKLNDVSNVVVNNLKPNGFLICKSNKNLTNSNQVNSPSGFIPITYFPTDSGCYIMLKKSSIKISTNLSILPICSNDLDFGWIDKLHDLLTNCENILLYAQGENLSGILGLVNCLRKEPETKNIRCLFICDEKAPQFDINSQFFINQLKLGLAMNVYKNGKWGTYRHLALSQNIVSIGQNEHVFATMTQIGDMTSLKWIQGPLTLSQQQVRIAYSSLNFKDIMIASGRLPISSVAEDRLRENCIFGFEYSGIDIQSGKRIMGMTIQGAFSSHLPKPQPICWEVPENWSMREAATIPVVYITVYYAFFIVTNIRKGKSILIHAGSGGVGLAAIRVAQAYGLEVYTTVSTKEKKQFLLKTFTQLNEQNIGYSRDTSFEDMIRVRTNGVGVDFVLNSLSEEKLSASIRCLSRRGEFLEIGKFDMANDNDLGLGVFLNELSFHAVIAEYLLSPNNTAVDELKKMMSDDIENGIIQPLPSTVFKAHELEQGFRFLMSGKHIGKVLLQIRDKPESKLTLPIKARPQIYFSPNLVYIIPGGLGGFGLELVDWMILRGARKIVLSSSRGITNDYQKLRIWRWESYSSIIKIDTSDISTSDGCLNLLHNAMKLGSIGGIFNLAVLLHDSIFNNQNKQLFYESFKPKAIATKYLDQHTRKLCPDLEYFVIFSSVSCGRGNAGQTNYGMANSIMERIIEDRVANNLPGKAIQWGAVGEVGLVAELAHGKIDTEIGGTLQQRISSCIYELDNLLITSDPIVASMVVAEKKTTTIGQTPIQYVQNCLSIRDIRSIPLNVTLSELGMDSLMSVEIKQTFERDYDIVLNANDFRSLTFARLIELSEIEKSTKTRINQDEETSFDSIQHLKQFYGQLHSMNESEDIFDKVNDIKYGKPLIILPGIDGSSYQIWRDLGKNLKQPTYVFQSNQNNKLNTMTEFIEYTTQNISLFLKQQNTNEFEIIAFSFGAMLAQLVIPSLEKIGFKGKAIFIDGSILFVENVISSLKRIYNGFDFTKVTIGIALSVLLPELSFETIQNDFSIKICKEELFKYIYDQFRKFKVENIYRKIKIIETLYQRLNILQIPESYRTDEIMDTELLLIRPSMDTLSGIDEYYGLAPLTRNEVHKEILDGNHQTILENEQLPNLINSYFSK